MRRLRRKGRCGGEAAQGSARRAAVTAAIAGRPAAATPAAAGFTIATPRDGSAGQRMAAAWCKDGVQMV